MVNARTLAAIRARLERYLTETCVIEAEVRETDIYGGPAHRWVVVASGVKCRVIREGESRSELVGTQEALVERYRIICPAGTALGIDQRVTVGGDVYQIVGVDVARTDTVDVQARIVRVRG